MAPLGSGAASRGRLRHPECRGCSTAGQQYGREKKQSMGGRPQVCRNSQACQAACAWACVCMGRRAYLLHTPNLLLARRRQAGPLLGTLIITRIGFSWLHSNSRNSSSAAC